MAQNLLQRMHRPEVKPFMHVIENEGLLDKRVYAAFPGRDPGVLLIRGWAPGPPSCYPREVPDAPGKPRLRSLDALRGIAALSVVVFHLTGVNPAGQGEFALGVTGVELFFIISGFVILMTLENTREPRDFLLGRFSRLYPAYWAAILFTSALILINARLDPGSESLEPTRFAANLTMLQHYLHQAHLDESYWTLNIELSFYALMFAAFLAKALRRLEWIGAALLPFAFVFRSPAFKSAFPDWHAALVHRLPIVTFFPLFLAGIVFYRMHREGPGPFRYALLAACLAAQIALFDEGGTSRQVLDVWRYAGAMAFYFGLFALFAHGRLGFLATPAALFFGKISFSLYLIHQYFSVRFAIPRMISLGMPFWISALSAFLASILVAVALTWLVEIPAREWLRARYLGKRPQEAAAVGRQGRQGSGNGERGIRTIE
jgi:peptidoglycan/LPS O-acetylase OafA/YrhL